MSFETAASRLAQGEEVDAADFATHARRAIVGGMEETKLEKFARLSGKTAAKALEALDRRGFDLRGKLSAPIRRVPRRDPPKPKAEN